MTAPWPDLTAGERPVRWRARRWSPGIALDMGSARTRAWLPGRGMVCDVPTVTFPGAGAYPVRRGSVVDVAGSARMLERLLGRCLPYVARRPLVVLTTPVLTGDDQRAGALRALEILRPHRVLTIDSVRAAALGAGADPAEPLLVADIGAQLTEVALLADGTVRHARRADRGTLDLDGALTTDAFVRTVVGMVLELLRADAATRVRAVDALARGLLLTGGGAIRPELGYALARLLRAPVRPVPAPHTAAVRGAATALLSAGRHPAFADRRS
ncbi:rod shape-determining protein [Streptomyces celluloflavus]|uniref:Rod shape-determining protein n=1 Tax=Streptomyces celluloflavus TaxID=58344 RepID=A0ABW7R8H2_9ACTN|nr:rod shape-determining protein [Streptomyces celluloflavus]